MRMFLIEKSGIYIEDFAGNSVGFKDIQELLKYSNVDFTYTSLNQVTYEPERDMHIWFDGVNTTVHKCPDVKMDGIINRVNELRLNKEDPYFGLSDQEKKDKAYEMKSNELLVYRKRLNNEFPFICNGIKYSNDEQNIQGVKVQILDKPRTDPLPTFPGTPMEGCWKTYDDLYVPFTNGEFIDQLCETYFSMRTHNFTNYGVLSSALKQLYDDETSTYSDIETFDVSVSWSSISVV